MRPAFLLGLLAAAAPGALATVLATHELQGLHAYLSSSDEDRAGAAVSAKAAVEAKADAKYEWPIAGSIERVHMASTQGDFLASEASRKAYWYTQRVDHFSATDARTFTQRFYVYEPAHVDPQSPVILYVSGAHALNGVPEDDVRLIAKHFAAPVVALEHRYYGESQPFGDLETKSLEFLETRQAVADLANFRDFFQAVYNRMHVRERTAAKTVCPVVLVCYQSSLSLFYFVPG
jgi:hypothetical protein